MSHLSIRKVPPLLDKAIRQEAKKRMTTKTEVVLDALKEAFGLKNNKKLRRDIRGFFGKMTKQDYAELQKNLGHFSTIDEELWK